MEFITVETTVNAPISVVWDSWNKPEHITHWAFASDDWEAPTSENDVRVGGRFKTKMAAKDKSAEFDFTGTYTAVEENKLIEYDMDKSPEDEKPRHVKTKFEETPQGVKVTETFDPENENAPEMQKAGWQAILDNFKKYTEGLSSNAEL